MKSIYATGNFGRELQHLRWRSGLLESAISPTFDLPEVVYHATPASNIVSIKQNGILVKYYGAVHGRMEINPGPAIYLSPLDRSDNLHSSIYDVDNGRVVVFHILLAALDENHIYPDDSFYIEWGDEMILEEPKDIADALGIPLNNAMRLFRKMERASNNELPQLAQPFWRWYLEHNEPIAYTKDIPPTAIVGMHWL